MYVFDNAAPQAPARLTALASAFDPGTIRHLQPRVQPGWRCLEIGGGCGSITRWLSERVGPRGYVLTTDIDTRHLEPIGRPNVVIRRHDIARDPLPDEPFDLAHTRLVLQHVSDPERALDAMVAAVKPGGWIVVEDFEVLSGSADSDDRALERISRTAAAMRQVTAAAGADSRFGRSLPQRLRRAGLTDVDVEGRVFIWTGGTDGAAITRLSYEQLKDAILATGLVTPQEYEADVADLEDPSFEIRSPVMWTAWGRRPIA